MLREKHNEWTEHIGEVVWTAPFTKLKYKYLNNEWQQIKEYPDQMNVVTNFDHVNDVCQSYLSDTQELLCYVDAVNYTAMSSTPITKDMYQFVTYHAYVIREGFEKELAPLMALLKEGGG